jgi:hypothetical protein
LWFLVVLDRSGGEVDGMVVEARLPLTDPTEGLRL